MKHARVTRILAIMLALSLCGLPEALAQAAKPLPNAPSAARLLAQNQLAQNQVPQNQEPAAQNEASPQPAAPAQTQSQEQPRVVPVAPQGAPGTETEQQPADAAADAQQEGTAPRVIPPPSPAELQGLQSAQQENQPPQPPVNSRANPVGTAAAESAPTAGGGASRPAGVAIAPAKQKRSRSLLIKLGAALAAGAALGTVYGLSRSTKTGTASQ